MIGSGKKENQGREEQQHFFEVNNNDEFQGHSRTNRDKQENPVTFKNIQGHSGTFRDIQGNSSTFRDILGYSRTMPVFSWSISLRADIDHMTC